MNLIYMIQKTIGADDEKQFQFFLDGDKINPLQIFTQKTIYLPNGKFGN